MAKIKNPSNKKRYDRYKQENRRASYTDLPLSVCTVIKPQLSEKQCPNQAGRSPEQ